MPIIPQNIIKNHSNGIKIPRNDNKYLTPNNAKRITPTLDANFNIFSTKNHHFNI